MTSDKRRNIILSIFIGLLILVPVVVILPTMLNIWDAFRTKRPDIAYIGLYTEIQFPPSAERVGSVSYGGQDRSITAAIKMRRGDVHGFISGLLKTTNAEELDDEDIHSGRSAVIRDNLKWWDMNLAKKLRVFETKPRHPKSNDTRCTVFVREDDPNYAVVYLDGLLY